MAFRVKPDFSAVWASLGDNTKPVDSYITNGWETVKPPRQYFNWIDNRQDSAIAYLYQAGIPEWDAFVDYEGGAGVNSYSQGSDGKVYRCLADNGPNVVSIGAKDPTNPLNSAFWVEAFGTKAAVDALAATVATHTTQLGNGSGVTNAAAWRTALSVPSTTEAVVDTDFTGTNRSHTAIDGFQKFPGGFIDQWTIKSSLAVGWEIWTLPVPLLVPFVTSGSVGDNSPSPGTAKQFVVIGPPVSSGGFVTGIRFAVFNQAGTQVANGVQLRLCGV